jgi:D(-)-tartrate dehydratase
MADCIARHSPFLAPFIAYGLLGFCRSFELLEERRWPRAAFRPHRGRMFCLHVVAALGLGGTEVNPLCFLPFGSYGDDMIISEGAAALARVPGVGLEEKRDLINVLGTIVDG